MQDQVVLITGGARGVGLATGRALAARGARVALADLDGELARSEAAAIRGAAGYDVDVGDRASFAALLDDVERDLGPVGVLVNNAAVMHLGPFLDTPPAIVRQQIDTNLLGAVHGMQLAVPRMIERGRGHVVNVNSAAGKWGVPGENVYCAAKWAVVGLTELLREELRGTPVHLSLVFFGPAPTRLSAGMRPQRGIAFVANEAVADAIAGVLARPRFESWVPRSLGWSAAAGRVMPRPLREAMQRLAGLHRVATDVDRDRRAAYEQEAFGSAYGAR